MNILIIGSGGREHALAWKIRQSPLVSKLYCAPGNAGIAECAELIAIRASDTEGLLEFAKDAGIALTLVGPEAPLTNGLADRFEDAGLKVFGPRRVAAELEGSKAFAKEFMKKYRIPTAEFRTFDATRRFDAERYINEVPVPVVIKADGLAAGKGVSVCETKDQALEVLDALMGKKILGEAGTTIVIEDFLVGEEASVFALTDGRDFVTLPPAQDHKRILDNDQGKNTGGMGAYAPAPVVTEEMLRRVGRDIIRPTILGMARENRTYRGCLYVGLMITETGPKVIEYNCRFGDPETQAVLPLLEDDLVPFLVEAASGKLTRTKIPAGASSAVCVVIASGGYPDEYEVGKPIVGLDALRAEKDVLVFHAGTRSEKGLTLTAGGRVLGITALGPAENLERTIANAYRAVERITFDGAYYRSDIGRKGLERLKQTRKDRLT